MAHSCVEMDRRRKMCDPRLAVVFTLKTAQAFGSAQVPSDIRIGQTEYFHKAVYMYIYLFPFVTPKIIMVPHLHLDGL